MPIGKPVDGTTSWGQQVRAAIGAINAAYTVYSTEPPPGLTAIAADGTTNDASTVQAHLNYVKNTYGGGHVVLSKPGGAIKFNTGITIPAGVQLVSNEHTRLDFSGIGSGTAITVNDQDFTPLVGVYLEGPNAAGSLANASTGISVTGIGLRFYNTRIRYFGRGVDVTHSNTFILTFVGGDIGHCGTCIYADFEAAGAIVAGERIVFEHFTIYNAARGMNVTGNGTSFYLTNCSVDFCMEFGRILNAWMYFTGDHLEGSGGSGTPGYLFDVTGNSHMFFSNTNIIMAGGGTNNLNYLFNPANGPSNYGFGRAVFATCNAFFVDQNGSALNFWSEHMLSWPAGTTTQSLYVPWPIRWCAVTAEFCATDGYSRDTADTVQITGMNSPAGRLTLTTPSSGAQRWIRLRF